MYLLYTDESNLDPTKADFFVCAGVAGPGDRAAVLSAEIGAPQTKHGYQALDLPKFTSNRRPGQVSAQQHMDAKRERVEAAARHEVKLRDGGGRVTETSPFFSPKIVRVPRYLNEYTQLRDFLTPNGIEAAQIPTNLRTY